MNELKLYRKDRGVSQKLLAQQIGVSEATIIRWEQGKSSPTAKELLQLSTALGVTPNELLNVNTETKSEES